MRVLLVEDDRSAARGIAFQLRKAGMIVDIAETGGETIELARLYDYDAIVLDVMLPDMEGFEVVSRLRASKHACPILMLSSLARTQAKVRGLQLGADDYLSKPFEPDELTARIGAMVRRSKGVAQPVVQAGDVTLDLNSKEVSVAGVPLHLTAKEHAILELLMLRRGNVLSKENFLDHLYGGIDEPDAKIIDVFICKLRKKLQSAGAENIIGTVWGRGYIIRDPAPAASAQRQLPHAVLSGQGVASITGRLAS